MAQAWIIGVGIVAVVLGVVWGARGGLLESELGLAGDDSRKKPQIWWYVDDGEPNSRQWYDFGNRATIEPNEPFLKLCLHRARELWMTDGSFELQPVIGRRMAISLLNKTTVPEGIERVPPMLFLAWCRAEFLAQHGGLWLDGSVLPLATSAELKKRIHGSGETALTFGVDPDEGLAVNESKLPAAGPSAGWAAMKGHPVWSGLARDLTALIAMGPRSWGSIEARRGLRTLWDKHCSGIVRIDRAAEVSRDTYGRRLELDTLLGGTEWAAGTKEGGLWVPLPDGRDGLDRAVPYQWFSRMSVAQIKDSHFVWAKWSSHP